MLTPACLPPSLERSKTWAVFDSQALLGGLSLHDPMAMDGPTTSQDELNKRADLFFMVCVATFSCDYGRPTTGEPPQQGRGGKGGAVCVTIGGTQPAAWVVPGGQAIAWALMPYAPPTPLVPHYHDGLGSHSTHTTCDLPVLLLAAAGRGGPSHWEANQTLVQQYGRSWLQLIKEGKGSEEVSTPARCHSACWDWWGAACWLCGWCREKLQLGQPGSFQLARPPAAAQHLYPAWRPTRQALTPTLLVPDPPLHCRSSS